MATSYFHNFFKLYCNIKLYVTLSLVVGVLRNPSFVLIEASTITDAPVIPVTGGLIRGKRVPVNNPHLISVDQYLGVPYAAPPIGNLRFRPPHLHFPSWDGVRDATTFGKACMQLVKTPDQYDDLPGWKRIPLEEKWPFLKEGQLSEDCLFLNLYVPRGGKIIYLSFYCNVRLRTCLSLMLNP